MKINGLDMKDIQTIENNYDNIGILNVIQYLLGVVVNDINFMNDASDINNEEIQFLDLGNNTKIKKDHFGDLYTLIDSIYFINKYNEGATTDEEK